MKRHLLSAMAAIAISFMPSNLLAQNIAEDFNDITTLPGSGWYQQNNSSPVGTNPVWFQGNPPANGGPFNAYSGAANSYVACNFNSTAGGSGTISNWLVAPNRTFKNGDVITFWTRKYDVGQDYPDRMEVRFSTNGASTNVGSAAADVGDFTTLLLSINPTLIVGGYPRQWTQYTITISGLPAPTSGRMAFRYFVTSAGPTGTNSDYIGVDEYRYTQYVCPTFTMTPSGALAGGAAGSPYNTTLTQTGALGAPTFVVTAGTLPPGLTLSTGGTISGTPTATGTFNFTVTVSDNSGCSASAAYSITTICGPNPTSLSSLPVLCNNAAPYTLTEGSPAGGNYSGTGVSAGQFDPAAGTQTITYNYIDPYGCSHSSSSTLTVNTAPAVTLGAYSDVCENSGLIDLTGGQSPVGGAFSGTGVTGNDFDPTSGTQNITYSYTDANGCSNSASQVLTVHAAPVVTLATYTAVCSNAGLIDLTGGQSPAGGSFSGTGVSGNNFDPASGTQTITYSFTDSNSCSNTASQILTVNTAPTASITVMNPTLCISHASEALTGTPAGGTFSGSAALTGNMFNPATAGVGTHNVSYTFTDGNGCSDTASASIQVLGCAGIEDESSNLNVNVYPNPSVDFIQLDITSGLVNSEFRLEILGMDGKVYSTKNLVISNNQVETIQVSNLAAGAYFVKLQNNNGDVVTRKFIKK